MPVDLRSGIVRILRPNGATAGTGFVVSADGLIATCSHVVQDVAALQRGEPRPEIVRVVFAANGEERQTQVEPECWLPREQGDVAILCLEGGLPEDVEALPLGPAAGSAGHAFRTRGFRGEGERAGSGQILDLVMVRPGRDALQLRSQEVTQGFSGAPVWDEQAERVVGMVSEIMPPDQHSRGRDTAFATTSETLGRACPSLQLSPASAIPGGMRTRHRLLVPIDSFVGRQRLVAEVVELLGRRDIRLLTLTGTGGVGKTRLALEVGRQVEDDYSDGACLVDLSPLTDPTLVASAILQALGVREDGTQAAAEQLQDYLAGKHFLLVLDNFEHLLEAGSSVARLLRASTALTVLTTSRSPLIIGGEQEFAVEPMELPNLTALPPVDDLARSEAVELFVRRAQAVLPDFALTEANASSVAEICIRLDGLPLAIELAAARVRLFPDPAALLDRLEPRLPMLVGGRRDAPARQRTMRDTIAWSYELLSPDEQALFRRIGIFVSRFSLEAVPAVIHAAGSLGLDPIVGLEALVLASLLQRENAQRGDPTFLTLETIREFALDELDRRGETGATQRAHARYYLTLTEAAEPHLKGPEQREWLDILDGAHDELRAALTWLLDSVDIDSAMRLAAATGWFWQVRGHHTEGRKWLDRVLVETSSPSPRLLAQALGAAGFLAFLQGDYQQAWSFHDRVLGLRRGIGDRQGVAATLANLATVLNAMREYPRAKDLYMEALELMREVGDEHSVGSILTNLGTLALSEGDAASAAELQAESVGLMRKLGDNRALAVALVDFGTAEHTRRNMPRAIAAYEEALVLGRELGEQSVIAAAVHNLGDVAKQQGDPLTAQQHFAESLSIKRQLRDKRGIAITLHSLANAAREAGHLREATDYYQELVTLGQELHDPRTSVYGLMGIANVARDQNLADQAAAQYKYCLAICRRIEYRDGIATALNNLAVVTNQGRIAKLAMLDESLTLYREIGNLGGAAASLHNIGDVMHESGDSQDAIRLYREGLQIERDRGYKPGIALFFESIARVIADQGQPDRATRLYAAAELIRDSASAPLPYVAQAGHDREVDALRRRMRAVDFERAWTAGRQMPIEDALAEALNPD